MLKRLVSSCAYAILYWYVNVIISFRNTRIGKLMKPCYNILRKTTHTVLPSMLRILGTTDNCWVGFFYVDRCHLKLKLLRCRAAGRPDYWSAPKVKIFEIIVGPGLGTLKKPKYHYMVVGGWGPFGSRIRAFERFKSWKRLIFGQI